MFSAYLLRGLFPIALFVAFLIFGILREALTWKGVLGFVAVVAVALTLWIYFEWLPFLFAPFLIFIDIILLFKVFKGDVTID